mmetsp:Transcript_129/g.362  ORF Transcript_129/g.362 Transcript_129/m.362 type:complete len:281 (+) Transcript_129:100-942(+)
MGLLDLYENAHKVRTEYHRSIASIDHTFASDLAASYNKALEDEEHTKSVCENEADAQLAFECSDEIEESQKDEFTKAALDVAPTSPARATSTEQSCGYERTVEICKRPGETRVGLELEKIRRDVIITAVRPGLPADEANLSPGDTLIAVNGVPVTSATAASKMIAVAQDAVLLTTRALPGALEVTLDKPHHAAIFGFDLNWDGKARELRLSRIEAGSPAAEGALEVGDVLVAVSGVRLDRASTCERRARELLRTAPAGPLSLRIVRAERAIAESLGLISR